MSDWVRITEVGPRDGLQNEAQALPTTTKIAFVDALSAAGFPEIEVGSFVSPRAVPKMADSAEVFNGIVRRSGTIYSALVPNSIGMDAALAARVDKVSVFAAASETFSLRNTGGSIGAVLERFVPVIDRAHAAGLPVRAYVSCVVQCPYEGRIEGDAVRRVVESLLKIGADEIDLGETIGVASPSDIEQLLNDVKSVVSPAQLTLHLHDTAGKALECVERALTLGVRSFDSAAGGLGGCPFAPGAPGNVATEALIALLERLGYRTGIDATALDKAMALLRVHWTDSSTDI
ncbi:MAG: hydroxymethylglutaryl-CoA lyase [Planctomycetota bacterium]|nr:hydroxymethylglutaryl-CoA lyase [Planctomycetota bacterium]